MPSYEELTADLFDENKSSFRRIEALERLVRSDHPLALDAILQLVNDEDKNIRRKVASVLASYNDPRCTDALSQLMNDEDERVRENAIHSLAETGDPNAESSITGGLSDESWFVRRASRDALERLKKRIDEEQKPALDPQPSLGPSDEIPDVSQVLDQSQGPERREAVAEEGAVTAGDDSSAESPQVEIPSISEFVEEPPPTEGHAWCAMHPDREAIGICERCGNFICPECRETVDEKFYCSRCFETAAPRMGYTPWENRQELGFIKALWETTKQVLFSPTEFFRKMPVSGGIGQPLLFAVIFSIVGGFVQAFWQFGVQLVMTAAGMAAGGGGPKPIFVFMPAVGGSLFVLVCAPIAGIIGIFVSSALLHLSAMIVRARKYPIEATFRVLCYATATQAVVLVPVCGAYAAAIWALIVEIIGIREAHETTVGKAVLTVFLPIIFFCGLGVLVMAAIFGVLFTSGAFR